MPSAEISIHGTVENPPHRNSHNIHHQKGIFNMTQNFSYSFSFLLVIGLAVFNLQGVVNVHHQDDNCEKNLLPPIESLLNDIDIGSSKNVQPLPNEEALVSPKKVRRRLEFVHIPKTGGTAIESEAARKNITWSICHFAHPHVPPMISGGETHCPKGSLKFPWPGVPKFHLTPWWHTPPSYFRLAPANPYEGADLFCVVRNVYSRLISEYYYMGTYLRNYTEPRLNSVVTFNNWLAQILAHRHATVGIKGQPSRNRTSKIRYWFDAGHYIPQYDFVFEHRERIIHHVLKFENLTAEFDELMEQYDLSFIKLPERKVRQSHKKKLGVYNMTAKVLNLIEMIYEQDFLEWGYDVMSEVIPKETLEHNQRLVDRGENYQKTMVANPKAAGSLGERMSKNKAAKIAA